jgi:hypothetical protein
MPVELCPRTRCRCCGVWHHGVWTVCPFTGIWFFLYD